MGQRRNKTGIDFEKMICESKGWKRKSVNPRINWVGTGRSNWGKMGQVDFDCTKFIPNIEKSKLEKYDALNEKGEKIEIKKYPSSKLTKWSNYSEPIFKVASSTTKDTVINLFGQGNYGKSVIEYNKFVECIIDNVGDEILNGITKSNIGIQCEDRFLTQDELEYKWLIKGGWKGYNRLSIVFRIKKGV